MGLLDFLFGSKKQTKIEFIPDNFWLTVEAKFAGLAKKVEDRLNSETVVILLVAHFPDVLERLEELVEKQSSNIPLKAVLSANLNTNLAASLNLNESTIIDIFVSERHPLASIDERIVEFADALPCRCRLSFHLSLEDPWIELFTGDWVKDILRNIGMPDDEAIESQMVSRKIKGSQKALMKNVCGNLDAWSATEWLEKNCSDLGKN